MLPTDVAFIGDSWEKSFATSDWARYLTPSAEWDTAKRGGAYYRTSQRALVDELLASCVVLVDEAQTDLGGRIDGWACGWPGSLAHYVFVRQTARGRGVARRLLEALGLTRGAPIVYTHRSALLRGAPSGWRYDPASLMLGRRNMERRKVVSLKMTGNGNVPVPTAGGTIEYRETVREQDNVPMEFDPLTGCIYVHTKAHKLVNGKAEGLRDVELVVHVSQAQPTLSVSAPPAKPATAAPKPAA